MAQSAGPPTRAARRDEFRSPDDPAQPERPSGLLSVIVPVYDVAPFLPQCLASLCEQDYRELEFVLVDDGSTDGCAQILADFAARDERARVITQVNAGLGAARNAGLAAAAGEFVTFVDSDDVVPPGSYRAMVRTLRRSGSDFVVGCMRRMGPDSTGRPHGPGACTGPTGSRSGSSNMPEMVGDVFACNKVFRRGFFDAVVDGFPEGVRYEDQEPVLRAYLGAKQFDVLRRVTNWRVRSDGTSITQQKSDPADLRDRSAVMARVHSELIADAPESVRRAWLVKALGFDLRPYFAQVPRTETRTGTSCAWWWPTWASMPMPSVVWDPGQVERLPGRRFKNGTDGTGHDPDVDVRTWPFLPGGVPPSRALRPPTLPA